MTETLPQRRDVQKILTTARRAMHPRELAARLSLARDDYEALIQLLDELHEEGVIKTLPGGRVRIIKGRQPREREREPERDSQRWDGYLTVNPRGFGFVTSAGHDDVFIPANSIYEALHGDTVTIRVVGRSPKGAEGRIEEVVERRSPRVTGILQKRRKSIWLDPDDTRLRGPIIIVGDTSTASDGQAAVVDIVRFPQFSGENPEAELVEVLGDPGDPQTEVRKILIREGILEEHLPETLQNAEQMATLLRKPKLEGRRDLRSVPLPTIDPEDARDHDDAIWVERTKKGYRAWVAIADVSEYVRPDSPLDSEARERGCTLYLPDRAIPMLPRALAGDLCSLLPEVERYCMCVIANLDKNARVVDFEIVEGVMRSAARLTYGGVARTLGFDPESPQSAQADAMKADLEVLAELSGKLRRTRMERGALDLDLPEPRVILDEETSAPTEVKKRATRPGLKKAYALVEEMMLLANELVARWMTERKLPAIYRVHGQPDEEKLERLGRVADKLGVRVRVSELTEAKGAGKFLSQIQEHPRKRVLELLMLRSLKQATYDTNNVGHFGLASSAYLHFTSPIRRYPDLRVHRQIKRVLRGQQALRDGATVEDLQAAATESSKKERSAMDVEREVLDLYRALYMKRHLGDVFDGQVSGLTGSGLYIALEDPFCDVFVPYDALGLDHFSLDEDEISVTGERSGQTIMLGDTITVLVTDVSLARRKVLAKRVAEDHEAEGDPQPWTERGRSERPLAASSRLGRSSGGRSLKSNQRTLRGAGRGATESKGGKGGKSSAGRRGGKSGGSSHSATRSDGKSSSKGRKGNKRRR